MTRERSTTTTGQGDRQRNRAPENSDIRYAAAGTRYSRHWQDYMSETSEAVSHDYLDASRPASNLQDLVADTTHAVATYLAGRGRRSRRSSSSVQMEPIMAWRVDSGMGPSERTDPLSESPIELNLLQRRAWEHHNRNYHRNQGGTAQTLATTLTDNSDTTSHEANEEESSLSGGYIIVEERDADSTGIPPPNSLEGSGVLVPSHPSSSSMAGRNGMYGSSILRGVGAHVERTSGEQ